MCIRDRHKDDDGETRYTSIMNELDTAENLADFFTKPLNATKFHAMRRIIMNDFGPNAASAPATSVRGGASEG